MGAAEAGIDGDACGDVALLKSCIGGTLVGVPGTASKVVLDSGGTMLGLGVSERLNTGAGAGVDVGARVGVEKGAREGISDEVGDVGPSVVLDKYTISSFSIITSSASSKVSSGSNSSASPSEKRVS